MFFQEMEIRGAYVTDLEVHRDDRGFFARAWCEEQFRALGLRARLAQVNLSFNFHRGTLRGLHFQAPPWEEAKVVCCTRGAIYDVVLDLRQHSRTYKKWVAIELTAANHRSIYVPEGCAHGYQTLTAETSLLYLINQFYSPDHARGVRYDDPTFAIHWPLPAGDVSERDLSWPTYEEPNVRYTRTFQESS